ncbi:hypothetical protein KAFR_0I02090 [Kazachstania africana CBS 2517]|uniref:RING-type domain-containing protein n=1 Tax=Kazachstania africana (strain ATCC 22294 / BCRC 22015 / CBS 2517 / CECT 1963 / NBRC 1671 / NRRL Y-8276) TaxID=1071382 RepID=H2B039_KAZAF|nr:hypothetical protein KAFR_0I02090 [Kazachstania africana CBS 2517]CCF59989.1 hypothetical protein KAFR_0I02090 [Kazachstania africana CBS 2517]
MAEITVQLDEVPGGVGSVLDRRFGDTVPLEADLFLNLSKFKHHHLVSIKFITPMRCHASGTQHVMLRYDSGSGELRIGSDHSFHIPTIDQNELLLKCLHFINLGSLRTELEEKLETFKIESKKKRKTVFYNKITKQLRSVNKSLKDVHCHGPFLHSNSNQVTVNLDLYLLYKPNSFNKFDVETNSLLDLLYSRSFSQNDSEITTSFIQRYFINQTVHYTKQILPRPSFEDIIENLRLRLLPFQMDSIQWMLDKEGYNNQYIPPKTNPTPHELNNFLNSKICFGYEIVKNDYLFWNKFTNFILDYKEAMQLYENYDHSQPKAKGLLSEEMGLGKTIEILTLIMLNKRKLTESQTFLTHDNKTIHRTKTTLIICPNPLLQQWINEINEHTNPGTIKIFHYLGYNDIILKFKTNNIEDIVKKLSTYDVIITTYNIINLEIHYAQYNANLRSRRNQYTQPKYNYSSPLSLMEFFRIILDEVQMLKSDNTQAAKCTSLLYRVHTWGVSGTPIQNIRDFQTILSYLKISPFCENSDIVTNVDKNIGRENTVLSNGIQFSINDVMEIFIRYDICIRHSKSDVVSQIHIPKQTNYLIPLEFNPIEWDNYLNLWNDFILASGYGPRGENKPNLSTNQLNQWLTQLRYLCCHAIIPENLMSNTFSHGKSKKLEAFNQVNEMVHNINDILKIMTAETIESLNSLYRENYQLKIRTAQVEMELNNDPLKAIPTLKSVTENIINDLKIKFNIEDIFTIDFDEIDNDKVKIRSYLDLLNQCFFFIGTSYYFMGSKKLEMVDDENTKIKLMNEKEDDKKEVKEEKKYTDYYSSEELLAIEKNQLLEQENYEIAERLRKQILLERVQKVEETILEIQAFFNDTNKTTDKALRLQIIGFNFKDNFASNMLISNIFKALSSMLLAFNKQAMQFNSLIEQLIELLYKPISREYDDDNEEDKAMEYSTSIDDQDKIFAIFHCLEELLKNRDLVINSDEDDIKLNTKNSVQVDATFSQYHLDLLKNLEIIGKGTSLKSIFSDLKNSKIVRSSLTSGANRDGADFEDYLLSYEEEIGRINKEDKNVRESIKKLNLIYNSKIEYYSHLQRISDSLISIIQLEPNVKNSILRSIKDDKQYKENLTKISQIESRIKYLKNLSKIQDLIEQNKSFNCPICLNTIYMGSIIKCGHFFCKHCIFSWLKNKSVCPICKKTTNKNELYHFKFKNKEEEVNKPVGERVLGSKIDGISPSLPSNDKVTVKQTKEDADEEEDEEIFNEKFVKFPQINEVAQLTIKESFGAKIDFVIKLILFLKLKSQSEERDPPQILIYSQNFEFLKIITKILTLNHISHLSCFSNTKSISSTIEKFKRNNTITCLLMNVKTLGAGLNLLNAKHIFLLDPIINHNDELQAMSRNNRIGQMEETYVWNFMIKESVEENIFKYKCILENNKRQKEKFSNENDELEEEFEINENATEFIGDRHLWNCFFQKQ